MTFKGFPLMLERSLQLLTQESKLSFYKIIGNHNGSSTIIMQFAAIPHLADQNSSCPPLPSKPEEEKERRAQFMDHNKNKQVVSTPHRGALSSISPIQLFSEDSAICKHSPDTACHQYLPKQFNNAESVFIDSGNVHSPCKSVSDQKVISDAEHQLTKMSDSSGNETCKKDCVGVANSHVDSSVPETLDTESSPPPASIIKTNTIVCRSSPNLRTKLSKLPHEVKAGDSLTKQAQQLIQSKHRHSYGGIFRSIRDLNNAKRCAKNVSTATLKKLKNQERNNEFRRIAKRENSIRNGGPVLIAETDDLLLSFYILHQEVGHVGIFSESRTTEDDKMIYNDFYTLPSLETDDIKPSDFDALNEARTKILTFLRDKCP